MSTPAAMISPHPAGEQESSPEFPSGCRPVDTPGGRFYAEWDDEAPVPRKGQLIFFFQFLHTGGRWERFLRDCPLRYTGNRGSGARRIMGTAILSILNGHWRYAHINAVRGDGINPGLLGMSGTVSEDAVRLGIGRIEKKGLQWLSDHLLDCISPALGLPWILDIDTTVNHLYGHQQGSVIGYNPQKPSRPSHVYHSYFVAHLRISLGVELLPGNQHAAARGLPGLWQILDRLPRHQWPAFSRGDCAYGNETTIPEHDEHRLTYLFKVRHTPGVQDLVIRMMREGAKWKECGDGWEALETTLRLRGWRRERRVILVREKPASAPVREPGRSRCGKDRQSRLPNARGEGWDARATPWSGKIDVLITSLNADTYHATAMPRHHRERADGENCFDELKNQWGWSGYTSRRLGSSRIMANLIALVYNWWSLYLRFYDGEHHREAICADQLETPAALYPLRSG